MIRGARLAFELLEHGMLLAKVNAAMVRASKDVIERYWVKDARKIKIEIAIAPKVNGSQEDGTLQNNPTIATKVSETWPGHVGSGTIGYVEDDQLMINVDDAAHPNQGHLFPREPVGAEVAGNVSRFARGEG